jgi:hypothetical protein
MPGIYTTNLIVNGTLTGSVGANTVGTSNPTLEISSDVSVNGSVFSRGRVDTADTMFMTMRASSNVPVPGQEVFVQGTNLLLDPQSSDARAIGRLADTTSIWNPANGEFTVPVDGLYTLELQGSFSNNAAAVNPKNGVYFYFRNHAHPNARVAASFTKEAELVHAKTTQYLLKGDIIQPTFFSNDPDASLLGNGETYLSFLINNTTSVNHDDYFRL